MTVSWGSLRKGMTLEIDGVPYELIEYERQKMQQREPVTKMRLRDLRTGRSAVRTFQTTQWPLADVQTKVAQYLYFDGSDYIIMDMENFDQIHLSKDRLGEGVNFLKENMELELVLYKGETLNVRLPTFVDLKVQSAAPGFKGDTAHSGGKPATLETGITIQVPLHIKQGDMIKVDTRTGEYVEKA